MAEADEKGQMTKAYGFNLTTMQLGPVEHRPGVASRNARRQPDGPKGAL